MNIEKASERISGHESFCLDCTLEFTHGKYVATMENLTRRTKGKYKEKIDNKFRYKFGVCERCGARNEKLHGYIVVSSCTYTILVVDKARSTRRHRFINMRRH